MSWSLDEIITDISTEVDQSSTAPTNTGSAYALRRTYVNRALRDYGESYDWPNLLKEVNILTSNASMSINNLATITMPTDFRKLASFPLATWDGTQTSQFAEIDVTQKGRYVSSDHFVYPLRSGPTINLIFNVSTMASGASISLKYYSSPASLASPVDVANIPDPTYLVQKAIYYEYKGAEDQRFIEADAKAESILARMIENENTRGVAYQENRGKTWLESIFDFRIGRD